MFIHIFLFNIFYLFICAILNLYSGDINMRYPYYCCLKNMLNMLKRDAIKM